MIRKAFILLFTAILLLSITGITVNMHYCGNNLISLYFTGKVKSCCGEKCKNCHNKSFQLKILDNYTKPFAKSVSNFKFFLSDIYYSELIQHISYLDISFKDNYSYSSSPPLYKCSNSFLAVFRL
jgi:hypothetical protein